MGQTDFNDYIDIMPAVATAQPNDGASFTPLPVGDYEFEIKSVEKGQTKGNESKAPCPQLVIEYEVATDGPQQGKTTRAWYVLDNNSAYHVGRLASLLGAAGVALDNNGGFSLQTLIGARLLATVEHEIKDVTNNDGTAGTKTYTRINRERAVPKAVAAAPAPSVRKPAAAATAANGPARPPRA